jgi:hypothetical protein
MPLPPPPILWKYRSWDSGGYTSAMISRGQIYFAVASELNDPQEYRFRVTYPNTEYEIDIAARELCECMYPNDTVPARAEHFEQTKEDLRLMRVEHNGEIPPLKDADRGMFCASEVYDEALMWSHYADGHRGICLGLSTANLPLRFFPARYSDEMPIIGFREFYNWTFETISKTLLTKAARWAYEKEWRSGNYPGAQEFPEAIIKVILGHRVTNQVRSAVMESIAQSGRDISVHQSFLGPADRNLVFDPPID